MSSTIKFWIGLAIASGLLFTTVKFTSSYHAGQVAIETVKARDKEIKDIQDANEKSVKLLKEQQKADLKKIQDLQTLNAKIEEQYEAGKKQVDVATAKYNKLIADGWRLRDPGKTTVSSTSNLSSSTASSTTTSSISSVTTPSSNELSRQTSEFLLGFSGDADKVVVQLLAAQAYAKELRNVCEKY